MKSKNFILVVIGQIISLFGNAALRFALPLHLLQITGSPALYGVVSAAAFIPILIMSPIGGMCADRVNKRNIMVILDFITAGITVGFLLLSRSVDPVLLIFVTLMLLYSISGFYQPSVQASVPFLVSQDRLVSANSAINSVSSLANLLGPVLGGLLYSAYGLESILSISAVCFFCSAVMEIFIQIPSEKGEKKGGLHILLGDLAQSVRFITRQQRAVGRITLTVALFNLFLSALIIIGLPIITVQVIHVQDSSVMLGYLQGIMGVGGLAGGIVSSAAGKRLQAGSIWRLILLISLLLLPVSASLFFQLPDGFRYLVLAACAFLIMALATMFTVQMTTLVQRLTPRHMIGKVLSWIIAISVCTQPIGQAVYGTVFEFMAGREWAVFFLAAAVCVLISLLFKQVSQNLSEEAPAGAEPEGAA